MTPVVRGSEGCAYGRMSRGLWTRIKREKTEVVQPVVDLPSFTQSKDVEVVVYVHEIFVND